MKIFRFRDFELSYLGEEFDLYEFLLEFNTTSSENL